MPTVKPETSARPAIQIEDLREAGQDGGDIMGYFCRGHVDFDEFARAANCHNEAFTEHDERYVRRTDSRHVWWRTVPIAGEPGCSSFHEARPASPGAWKATVADVIVRRRLRRVQREIDSYQRGHVNGFADGVNWAVDRLRWSNPELADKLIEAWRNGIADQDQKKAGAAL